VDKQNGEGGGKINIRTLNVRGMSDRNKRQRLFTFFKQRCSGIIYLQETYSLPGDEIIWEKEWDGTVYMSHGTRHSCGVAILIPKQYKCDIKEVIIGKQGRSIILRGTFNDNNLTLLNYYAPTSDKSNEQQQQLQEILPTIHKYFAEIIWGGDMNMILEPHIDKYQNTDKITKYATKIRQILEEYDLCDIWRLLHPDKRRYTWRRNTPKGIQQSRLDYFIIPQNMIASIDKCEIDLGMYTDHSIVNLEIAGESQNLRGRGFWKFNTSLLSDSDFVNMINTTIENSIEDNQNCENKGLKWDFIKMKVRAATISYASHKAKKNRELEDNLNKEIVSMQNSNEENDNLRYETVKKELEQLNNERTRGAQVRAKCTHLEFNEKNSKYFLNKEVAAAKTKNMTKLIDDKGQIFEQPKEIMRHTKEFYQTLYRQNTKDTEETIQQAEQYFLKDNDVQTIEDEDKQTLDNPITIAELSKAVKELPNNKTPGSDGLPVEFYKMFWSKIQQTVFESIEYAIETGEMSTDQKR
jgi:exonuclease III